MSDNSQTEVNENESEEEEETQPTKLEELQEETEKVTVLIRDLKKKIKKARKKNENTNELDLRHKIARLELKITGYQIEYENATDPNVREGLRGQIQTKENLLHDAYQLLLQLTESSSLPTIKPTLPPQVIKPVSLNGEILYEREEASRLIVDKLVNSSGLRFTPICDNCYGAGKTSLMYKFRNVLNSLPPEQWSWPEESKSLQNAVYIHVPMNYDDSSYSNLNFNDADAIDMVLVEKFYQIFRLSLHQQRLSTSSRTDFINSVNALAGDVKFLVHIDEVGAFERYEDGKNVLYRILHFGEAFRVVGHYYVVTGRSRYLHTVGKNFNTSDAKFSSPCIPILIPLPLLKINSIILMFKEHRGKLQPRLFDSNGEPKMDVVHHIYNYSGGVPRAVYLALECYKKSSATRQIVENAIRDYYSITLDSHDQDIFNFCIEISWAQLRLNDTQTISNNPITEIIARLGIYRDNYDDDQTFTLQVPYFLVDLFHVSSPTLVDIAKIPNKGDRLEIGFRRMFHLRAGSDLTSWTELGLPCLHSKEFPFPSQFFNKSLPFPKIANNGSNCENAAKKCMKDINTKNNISNTTFHSSCLPTLCSRMQIGCYYQPFEKSSSADAMIRCGKSDLLCFQFKNLQEPFKVSEFSNEMKKCIIPGWNVILVLVCSKGYQTDNKKKKRNHQVLKVDVISTDLEVNLTSADLEIDVNSVVPVVIVKGILLSINSVNSFLGQNTVSNFTSSSMYDDASPRQEYFQSILGKRHK